MLESVKLLMNLALLMSMALVLFLFRIRRLLKTHDSIAVISSLINPKAASKSEGGK